MAKTPPEHHEINYIEFPVLDIAESKRFYAEAFGWTFQDYSPEYCGILKDGGEAGGFSQEENVSPGGLLVVLFSKDLDATHAKVLAAGGKIVKETFEFPGGRRFHFADPNGHELAVWGEL